MIMEATNGRGADVVIEAVGSTTTYKQAFDLVRRGGKILAYGAAGTDDVVEVKPFEIYAKELTIVGSYAGSYETWPAAMALIASGGFDPSLIIDTETELSEINNMLSKLDTDKSIVKEQIKLY